MVSGVASEVGKDGETMLAPGEVVQDALTPFIEQDPEALRDPYPLFRRFRETEPVYWRAAHEVLLFRYEDVQAAFANTTQTSKDLARRPYPEGERLRGQLAEDDARLFDEVRAFEALQMSRTDDPTHARLRGLVQRAFTPKRIADMGSRVQAILDELLDGVDPARVIDLIDAVAYRLPMFVIFDMLGVPATQREDVRGWSEDIARYRSRPQDLTNIRRAHAAFGAFSGYVRSHIERMSTHSEGPDVMSALVEARYHEQISDDELVAAVVHLIFAGHETTTNLIGNSTFHLLTHPAQWEMILNDLALIPGAVDELLRFDTPIQLQHRIVSVEHEINGLAVGEGTHLVLMCGSANRDPEAFADPEELDITRNDVRHVSFGYGPHFCLGSALARLEARTFLTTVATRYPNTKLAASPGELEWTGPSFRGLTRLPVVLGP
jgi:cytochrome P450